MKLLPINVNNAGKLLSFPNGLCLYNGGTHTLDLLILLLRQSRNYFQFVI